MQRGPGEIENRGSQDETGEQPFRGTLPLSAHIIDAKHSQDRGERRRQPGAEFTDSEKPVGRRRQPEVEDWFFQPGLSEVARRHVVARDQHFPGDLGVARLVRTHQSQAAKTQEELDPDEPENQKQVAGLNSPEHVDRERWTPGGGQASNSRNRTCSSCIGGTAACSGRAATPNRTEDRTGWDPVAGWERLAGVPGKKPFLEGLKGRSSKKVPTGIRGLMAGPSARGLAVSDRLQVSLLQVRIDHLLKFRLGPWRPAGCQPPGRP